MRVLPASTSLLVITLLPSATSLSVDASNRLFYGTRRECRLSMSFQASPLVSTQPNQERKQYAKRRRKSPGAPLVDSALLRFISAQKRQQQTQQRQPLAVDKTTMVTTDEAASSANGETSFPPLQKNCDGLNGMSDAGIPPDESQTVQDVATDHQLNPWMGQFNRNRIAQKLVCLGVDEKSASGAGEKVQSHLLVRIARRRIRDFLRERDSMWQEPTFASNKSSMIKYFDVEPRSPEYGFDDVVELLLEYGLTGTDICTILTHSPSLALMMPRRQHCKGDTVSKDESRGETLEETMNRSFTGLLCNTLKLRKYDARKVLRSCPGLLSMKGSKSAMQVVAMMSKLGVSTSSVARNKAALPLLLSRSPAGLFRLISFLSSDAVRMPLSQIGPLLRRQESLEILDAVVPVPRLQGEESFDVNSFDLSDDTSTDQYVLSVLQSRSCELRRQRINEVYKNMTRTAWTLRNEIGAKDLGKVIAAYPSVLLLDATEQILPTANYLMDELGILEGDLPKVLQLYPVLLKKDIAEMEQVSAFFSSMGITQESQASILRAFPSLLTLDIETQMKPVSDYLHSIGIENVGRFVTRLPPVLGYSVEKELIPKWKFLSQVCMYANYEVTTFPSYFSYPFERVIKTRYEYLAIKGFPTDLIPVDKILRSGDKDFAIKVAADKDGGKKFQQFLEKRENALSGTSNRRRPRAKKTKKT